MTTEGCQGDKAPGGRYASLKLTRKAYLESITEAINVDLSQMYGDARNSPNFKLVFLCRYSTHSAEP